MSAAMRLLTHIRRQGHLASRTAAGFAACSEGPASGAGGNGGGSPSAPGGSARRQPPADELAGEAERLLRSDPDAMSPQGARAVLDFQLDRGQRPGASERHSDAATSHLESDVAKALDERAAQGPGGGGGGRRGGPQEGAGGGGGAEAGGEVEGTEGRGDQRAGDVTATGVCANSDDACSPAASDPATRFAPWGH